MATETRHMRTDQLGQEAREPTEVGANMCRRRKNWSKRKVSSLERNCYEERVSRGVESCSKSDE